MSRILLVRHGQASWGKRDYDVLSDLGTRQAEIAGEALRDRGVRPDLVVVGGLRRQQLTARSLIDAAGWEIAPEIDAGWDEYDHTAIITGHKPAYRSMTVMKADLARTFRPYRAFMLMFEKAMVRWAEGEHDEDYPETFAAFCHRVEEAFERVMTRLGPNDTAVVCSSAGAITWALTTVLDGDPYLWGRLQRVMMNASISTVTVETAGPLLLTFNEHSHLEAAGPGMLTSR